VQVEVTVTPPETSRTAYASRPASSKAEASSRLRSSQRPRGLTFAHVHSPELLGVIDLLGALVERGRVAHDMDSSAGKTSKLIELPDFAAAHGANVWSITAVTLLLIPTSTLLHYLPIDVLQRLAIVAYDRGVVRAALCDECLVRHERAIRQEQLRLNATNMQASGLTEGRT